MALSKSQIDRLGERLKAGDPTEDDLRMLDEYRRSFGDAYDIVVSTLRSMFTLQPTGRDAKSTRSIIDKLRRETIRLSQIQDIAGCRLLVDSVIEQNMMVEVIATVFEDLDIVDRRESPSHGYRAVHIIANQHNMAVEIQIRTALQHQWAQLSEKASDVFDPSIKYGGGDPFTQQTLIDTSRTIADIEDVEMRASHLPDENPEKAELLGRLVKLREYYRGYIADLIEGLEGFK